MAQPMKWPSPKGGRAPFAVLTQAPMSRLFPIVLAISVPLVACDGTLAGIGHGPVVPEAPIEEGADEPFEIEAAHLLVMHEESRGAPKAVARTREEAKARAEEALERIRDGEDFGTIVEEYTDEPGGAARQGALGRFARGMMVKPFSDAAFALDVGEVSEVVETPFGFHVIKRTE